MSLDSEHKEKLELFYNELLNWNATHNLTRYTNEKLFWNNVEDSIYPLEFINDFANALDIGSGNGFPAIPLAIIRQNCKFTLVEPNTKKASFLHILSLRLSLSNIEVIKQRVENIKLESRVDLITSRAVAKSEELIHLSAHLLESSGYFLFYKGSNQKQCGQEKNIIIKDKRVYLYQQNNGEKNG